MCVKHRRNRYFLQIFSILVIPPQVKASVCQEGESEKLNEKNRCLKWIGDQSNAEERQQKSQNQGYPPSVVGKFPKAERALEDVDRIQQYDNSQNKWENGEDDPRSNEADDTDDKQDDAQYEIGLCGEGRKKAVPLRTGAPQCRQRRRKAVSVPMVSLKGQCQARCKEMPVHCG